MGLLLESRRRDEGGFVSKGRKLVEVALPLEEINLACKAYKDRKVGTIRNLHKWFAPMPLPAWRALIYAALIDDPEGDEARAYHIEVIKRLVASGADLPDAAVLEEARDNLRRTYPEGLPPVFDPFCGGGSTLLEAQRLGLEAVGADLNPVPALISRMLVQLLPPIYGGSPVAAKPQGEPEDESASLPFDISNGESVGFSGFVQDVRYYARWVRERARVELEAAYPTDPDETVIAWLWARTAPCPNPACMVSTVLATSWWLCKKPGELAWIEPQVADGVVALSVVGGRSTGAPPDDARAGRGSFACNACRAILDEKYLRLQGVEGRLGLRMTAVVVQGSDGARSYREPRPHEVEAALTVSVDEAIADLPLIGWRSVNGPYYGLDSWKAMFTPRQLKVLSVLSDRVADVSQRVVADGGSEAWAEAVTTALALAVGKVAQANSTQVRWNMAVSGSPKAEPAFGRNDLPMLWDFAETNPFGVSVGSLDGIVTDQMRSLAYVIPDGVGQVVKGDARTASSSAPGLVATDPPYFDAIGYADLSDYFYIWHRRALRRVHPDLYATVAVPKEGELTALPVHHRNDRIAARDYFIEGFTDTFRNLQESLSPDLPMLVVYASKEQKSDGSEETRWASILTAMVRADLEITGTWPIHGTTAARLVGNEANAVAAYVVMVARPRPATAPTCSLQEFNRVLRAEMKPAVEHLQMAGTRPVDMAQAALGPGMRVFSMHRAVLDQSGTAVSVDRALRLIQQVLTEILEEQEGELDPSSRFAAALWEQHHWGDAPFGEADKLARPQGISVDEVVRASVVLSPRPGVIRLLGEGSLDRTWTPSRDQIPTAWEAVHHLADRLIDGGGVREAAALMGGLGDLRDQALAFVHRLHSIAARKGWVEDQERYNALIGSWSDLLAEAARIRNSGEAMF